MGAQRGIDARNNGLLLQRVDLVGVGVAKLFGVFQALLSGFLVELLAVLLLDFEGRLVGGVEAHIVDLGPATLGGF